MATIKKINLNNKTYDIRDAQAEQRIITLEGSDAGKSVRTIASEELIAKLISPDAQESLNTLEEIAAWIQDHPEDAAAMNEAIAAIQAQLNGIDAGDGTVKKYVDDQVSAATGSVKDFIDGYMAENLGELAGKDKVAFADLDNGLSETVSTAFDTSSRLSSMVDTGDKTVSAFVTEKIETAFANIAMAEDVYW